VPGPVRAKSMRFAERPLVAAIVPSYSRDSHRAGMRADRGCRYCQCAV